MNDEALADIEMWLQFLESFNGVTYFLPSVWQSSSVIHFYTDSAKSTGFAGYFKGSYIQGTWASIAVSPRNSIAYLEYVPVLLSLLVWGKQLANSKIVFHSDNQAVVSILN